MSCLFSRFHTEGTFAVKYEAAKIMAVPFIHFHALQGVIEKVWALVVGTVTGEWEGLLLAFGEPGIPNVPPSPVYNPPTPNAHASPPHCSYTCSPLFSESFLHQCITCEASHILKSVFTGDCLKMLYYASPPKERSQA